MDTSLDNFVSLKRLISFDINTASNSALNYALDDVDTQNDIEIANKIIQSRRAAVKNVEEHPQHVKSQAHSETAEFDDNDDDLRPIHSSRICPTLTEEQASLFGLNRIIKPKRPHNNKFSHERMANLSVARKCKVSADFLLDEDTENCTFCPSKSSRAMAAMQNPACGYDFIKSTHKTSFLDRTVAAERVRRSALDRARAEKDYKCLVDKKKCPVCESEQSYDEVAEKRKTCPKCNEVYVVPLVILKKKWKKQRETKVSPCDSAMSSPRPSSHLTDEKRQILSRLVVMS